MSNNSHEILPRWNHWGNGICLMTQKEYLRGVKRIDAVLRQLSRAKENHIALREEISRLRKLNEAGK